MITSFDSYFIPFSAQYKNPTLFNIESISNSITFGSMKIKLILYLSDAAENLLKIYSIWDDTSFQAWAMFTMLFFIQCKHTVTSGRRDRFSSAVNIIGAKFGATHLLRESKWILNFGWNILLINEKTGFFVSLHH